MEIVLRAIEVVSVGGQKHVNVVVAVGNASNYKKHHVGVDINVNRGRIITFLSTMYSIPPGEIHWPSHIVLGQGDIEG